MTDHHQKLMKNKDKKVNEYHRCHIYIPQNDIKKEGNFSVCKKNKVNVIN